MNILESKYIPYYYRDKNNNILKKNKTKDETNKRFLIFFNQNRDSEARFMFQRLDLCFRGSIYVSEARIMVSLVFLILSQLLDLLEGGAEGAVVFAVC